MKTKALVLALALTISSNTYAGRTQNIFDNGGIALGVLGLIGTMALNDCKAPSPDALDMLEPERNAKFCIDALKRDGTKQESHEFNVLNKSTSSDAYQLRKSLRIERVAAGGSSEPPEGCDAHHIVPKKDERAWAKDYVDKAREILAECNIGINSAENGVYLPRNGSVDAKCEGSSHQGLHNQDYYKYITDKLAQASGNGGCSEVKNALSDIKNSLIQGVL